MTDSSNDTAQAAFSDQLTNDLLQRAKAGDYKAFSALIKQYEPFVIGSSRKVCQDLEKATATAQDTLINIFRKLHQFEGDSKFTTWLYSIILNNCMMNRRKRMMDKATVSLDETDSDREPNQRLSPSEILSSKTETPIGHLLNYELKGLLAKAIDKLPKEYQQVFLLRDVEGLSTEKTAKSLGLTVPAVKSRLHRARKILREELEHYVGLDT